jgi:glycosyltransferase involved in cell wall biosynthesis
MGKKILLIPSWYPTPKNPLKGSFFREQSEFLQKERVAEIKILYGDERSTPFLKLIWIYGLSLLKGKWSIHRNLVIQSPEAFGFIIPKNRRLPEKYRVKLARRLYKKAYRTFEEKNWKPDLIHAQSGMDAGIYAHDISKLTEIPFLIIEHQVFVFHHYSREKAKLVLDAFKVAYKVGTVSQDQRRQILMNQPECNPVLIPNLVNEESFSLKEKEKDSKFKIVTMMYANTIKGYETFFKAMSILKDEGFDFAFTVIGNGYSYGKNVFGEWMEKFDLESFGKIVSKVEREDIALYLRNADVYVCSSDYETFGIAPREAMLCGLPIVSTANGGVEDSISGDMGLIVPVKSPKELANALIQVKENYSNYDPNMIRNLVIDQCGRKRFLNSMSNFYFP